MIVSRRAPASPGTARKAPHSSPRLHIGSPHTWISCPHRVTEKHIQETWAGWGGEGSAWGAVCQVASAKVAAADALLSCNGSMRAHWSDGVADSVPLGLRRGVPGSGRGCDSAACSARVVEVSAAQGGTASQVGPRSSVAALLLAPSIPTATLPKFATLSTLCTADGTAGDGSLTKQPTASAAERMGPPPLVPCCSRARHAGCHSVRARAHRRQQAKAAKPTPTATRMNTTGSDCRAKIPSGTHASLWCRCGVVHARRSLI